MSAVMNSIQANAAAECELNRMQRHNEYDESGEALDEYTVTCEITIQATSKESAQAQMRELLNHWLSKWAPYDVVETDIVGVKAA